MIRGGDGALRQGPATLHPDQITDGCGFCERVHGPDLCPELKRFEGQVKRAYWRLFGRARQRPMTIGRSRPA